jgi:lipoprotein-releasing system permease protein
MLFSDRRSGKTTRHLLGSILGIAISLVPLITVIEVSGGMIEGITRRFIEIGSYHLQIRSYSPIDEEQEKLLLDTLQSDAAVVNIHPLVFGEGLVYSKSGKTGVSVRSLEENYYQSDPQVRKYLTLEAGSFELGNPQDALLSAEVAAKLEVSTGDQVRLLTARAFPGRAPVLRPTNFTVRGIFSTGYYELDALSMYIPIATGRVLFTEAGSYVVGIKLKDPYGDIDKYARRLTEKIGPEWRVHTWYSLERPMIESFATTRTLLIFVMAMIVAVAAVNISSSMLMLVIEKEPEIAMLKSMGISSRLLTHSFLFTGFFIGLSAVLLGLGIGLPAAVHINEMIQGIEKILNIGLQTAARVLKPFGGGIEREVALFDESYYLETIPIRIEFLEVLLTAMGTILAATAAAFFPARRAGTLKPLTILRKH